MATITYSYQEIIFRAGALVFAAALIKMGIGALTSPESAAVRFGLPASTPDAIAYVPAWGIRDLGFGAAILLLLGADSTGVISDGGKATAIVTAAGASVGLADGLYVRSAGGKGALGHVIGASGMAAMALGLWVSSRKA